MQRSSNIIFVTTNEDKFKEVSFVLSKIGILVNWLKDEKEEIQSEDTSEIASRAGDMMYRKHAVPLIVEDTGLFVRSLRGFPGCFASYVYKTIGIQGLLKLLEGKEREAYFVSSICYVQGSLKKVFTGRLEGRIAEKEAGSSGFGFDPVFVPKGMNKTLAELTFEEKCAISHRAKAANLFGEWFKMGNIYEQ